MLRLTAVRFVLMCLLAVCGTGSAAYADVLFGFGYGSTATSASGTIGATDNGDGSFTPFAIDGNWNGNAITGLLPAGTFANDNILYYGASPAFLSASGLGFNASGTSVNVYFDGAYHQLDTINGLDHLDDFLLGPIAFSRRFTFSYNGEGVSASGLLDAWDLGGRSFVVFRISGQRNGSPITGLVEPFGYFGLNDNELSFPDQPYVTQGGIAFSVGPDQYNFYARPCIQYTEEGSQGSVINLTDISIQEIPEPALWPFAALVLAGLEIRRRCSSIRSS